MGAQKLDGLGQGAASLEQTSLLAGRPFLSPTSPQIWRVSCPQQAQDLTFCAGVPGLISSQWEALSSWAVFVLAAGMS